MTERTSRDEATELGRWLYITTSQVLAPKVKRMVNDYLALLDERDALAADVERMWSVLLREGYDEFDVYDDLDFAEEKKNQRESTAATPAPDAPQREEG